jgi:hypothetical protein
MNQQESTVFDSAHLVDIEGAFGRISVSTPGASSTVKTRLLTLLADRRPGDHRDRRSTAGRNRSSDRLKELSP